mgnify:CR=1 FL=1
MEPTYVYIYCNRYPTNLIQVFHFQVFKKKYQRSFRIYFHFFGKDIVFSKIKKIILFRNKIKKYINLVWHKLYYLLCIIFFFNNFRIYNLIIFRSYRKKRNDASPSENDSEESDASKQITSTSEEESNHEISPEVRTQILAGLQRLEAKEYFLQQECNAYNVAKKIKFDYV